MLVVAEEAVLLLKLVVEVVPDFTVAAAGAVLKLLASAVTVTLELALLEGGAAKTFVVKSQLAFSMLVVTAGKAIILLVERRRQGAVFVFAVLSFRTSPKGARSLLGSGKAKEESNDK